MALIPEAPISAVLDPQVHLIVTAIMGAMAAAALIYSLIDWTRSRRPTFLLLFIAGGAMMLIEPLVDLVGGCWFPVIDGWVVFSAYGRPMPLWLCLAYFAYFGVGVGVSYRLMQRRLSPRQIWLLFAAGALGDFLLEVPLLHYGPTIYYGNQPLRILMFPAWWGAVNSLVTMVCAATVYRFDDYLRGPRQLLIIPIAISVSTAVNCAAGWPSWLVINTELPTVVTQLGGLATWALALWFMAMVVKAVAAPSVKSLQQDCAMDHRPPAISE